MHPRKIIVMGLSELLLLKVALVACTPPPPKAACNRTCGNLSIPYPFGATPDCYKDPTFLITCNSSSRPPIPYLREGNIQVLNISLDTGEMRVSAKVATDCNYPNGSHYRSRRHFSIQKFSISNTKNKFTVVGCDNYAYISDFTGDNLQGCMSTCSDLTSVTNETHCSGGVGCCEATFPKGIQSYNITLLYGTGCTPDTHNLHVLIIPLGVSVALLIVFTLVSTLCWAQKQKTLKHIRQRNFEENGGNMLLQQLSQRHGYNDRTKIFTENELKNATNNFDKSRILGSGGQGIVYKGILSNNTPVAIKKFRVGGDPRHIKDFINELFVLSQINHRNVVKLLGCCLETEVPLLVYEFVDNGTLFNHIDPKNECSITWETRLRIAAETAEAISYLHSAASIPIIHRDIKSANILLDHNNKAKVSDFGASRLFHLNETHVATIIQGTIGYLDPEYLQTGQLNEKSDVYSFGVVLVELLTGNKATEFNRLAAYFMSSVREDCLWEILDKRVLGEKKNAMQLKEVALLAKRCLRVNGEERPNIKEVAMELQGLIAIERHHWGKDKDMMAEEGECLLDLVSNGYGGASGSASITIEGYDHIQKAAFEIADGR